MREFNFGKFHSGPDLIEAVRELWFIENYTQRHIAQELEADLGDVLSIIAGTWGIPEWYEIAADRLHHRIYDNVPKRGRPRMDEEEKASERLQIRCRQVDLDKWSTQAALDQIPLSRWVVERLNAGAFIEGRYRADGSSDDYLHAVQHHARELKKIINDLMGERRLNNTIHAQVEINRLIFALERHIEEDRGTQPQRTG